MAGTMLSGSASTDLGAGSLQNGQQLTDQLQAALAERRKRKQQGLGPTDNAMQPLGNAAKDLFSPQLGGLSNIGRM